MKSGYRWAAGAVLLVVVIVIVGRADDWIARIEYPLDVWRMDLDDLAANVGVFLVGLAAIITVYRKADKAQVKADAVSERVNGGLEKAAREHLQDNEIITTMLHRMDNMEKQRDDCRQDLTDLRSWINTRLDDSGNGRNEER